MPFFLNKIWPDVFLKIDYAILNVAFHYRVTVIIITVLIENYSYSQIFLVLCCAKM